MTLPDALPIAEEIRGILALYCERCEIAGSIRRRKAEVGDVEIVCIRRNRDLPAFIRAVEQWEKIKGSPKGAYTQRRHPSGMKVDIFMATRDNFGLILAIRTGSARFSHEVLARGWVKAGYHSQGGMLYRGDGELLPGADGQDLDGPPIAVREERDLFTLIGLPWVDPEERS